MREVINKKILALYLCLWILLILAAGCSTSNSRSDEDDDENTDAGCTHGDLSCDENIVLTCENGEWVSGAECPDDEVCIDGLGCVVCEPLSARCNGQVREGCSEDGMNWEFIEECEEDEICLTTGCSKGTSDGDTPKTCEDSEAMRSNIGCEYWAVDLDNAENVIDDAAAAQFAVVVANIGVGGDANIKVHINSAEPGDDQDITLVEEAAVPQGEIHIFRLPRRDVDGDNITPNHDDGPQTWLSSRAFRVTSDKPVVAYQFNTLDQQFSNDASLLLPTSGLYGDYWAVTWPPTNPIKVPNMTEPNRCYVTVVGVEENTKVAVTPTYDIQAGPGVEGGIKAGETGVFTLNKFDVLNLENHVPTTLKMPDLTGTKVHADKRVAVFTGVDLAMVTTDDNAEDSCCAEHIEMQVMPTQTMGKKFVVARSAPRASENDYYRILADKPNTTVTTSSSAAPSFTIAEAGGHHDFFTDTGFILEADNPVQVIQLLVIGTEAGVHGDSSMIPVPAVEEQRSLYVFTTGEGFRTNWAVITAEKGQTLRLDGNDVTSNCGTPMDIGTLDGKNFEQWICEIEDGDHTVASADNPNAATDPIGVQVYGYYNAGSYGYPAGSDLREINPIE